MPTRTDRNQTWDRAGNLIFEEVVETDITAETNESSVSAAALAAWQANKDFLALPSPTNAQNAAQVKALTRQNNALIRLLLNRFDGTD